jgi:hypothetical protein
MRIKIPDLQGPGVELYHKIGYLLDGKPTPLIGMVLSKLIAEMIADCEPCKRAQVRDAVFMYVTWAAAKLEAEDTPQSRH